MFHLNSTPLTNLWFSLRLLIACFEWITVNEDLPPSEFSTFTASKHTNNWAVLIGSSPYWYDYRIVSNTLSMYHSLRRLGIPDSQIIVMLPDDFACNGRNKKPGTVYNRIEKTLNLNNDDVEIDYRGDELTIHNILSLLTDRLPLGTPRSKRLLSNHNSNVLIYISSHGGNGYVRVREKENIWRYELSEAIAEMWSNHRYNELLLIINSCQSSSMHQLIDSPNVAAIADSQVGEDSYSSLFDRELGLVVVNRYIHNTLQFVDDNVHPNSTFTLQDFIDDDWLSLDDSEDDVKIDLNVEPNRLEPWPNVFDII